ncbi:MAG: radical SAM protein [Thermodesulfobacteriota bacterium]
MRDNLLTISEIFYSIQGESSHAGLPCLFFRLSGCNLRCSYCDARYACDEPGEVMPIDALLAEAARHPGVLVEITGGEPLLQEGVYPLMEGLLAAGRTVLLETNGSLPIDRVPAGVCRILDLKCPDSGMNDWVEWANLSLLTPRDEIKFVVSSRRDYEWAREILRMHGLGARVNTILSPVTTRLAPAELASWLLEDRLPARLQLQLHTLLWPGKKRGA